MTTTQKFLALKAIDKRVYLTVGDEGRWIVRLPSVKFYSKIEPRELSGDAPEKAVEETWFRLTWKPDGRVPDGRVTSHIDQEKIIVTKGNREHWMIWNGFMWEQYLEQAASHPAGTA